MEFEFSISEKHPSLSGHFPGHPVVPGVIILNEVINAVANKYENVNVQGFSSVKFNAPLKPEQNVRIVLVQTKKVINFECNMNSTLIASGSIRVEGI
jgi:3-hydroxymyristoyl/3-hydroxydecanoyl-(acyl carrier protein) dehydratase